MPDHTPGKLDSLGGMAVSMDDHHYAVFYCGLGNQSQQYSEERIKADTRRLVACWNAFEGTPTEVIEGMRILPPKGEGKP